LRIGGAAPRDAGKVTIWTNSASSTSTQATWKNTDSFASPTTLKSGNEHLWSRWDDFGEQDNLIAEMPEKAELLQNNMDGSFERLGWDQTEHIGLPKKKKQVR
jgi:hypothetical protein